MDIALIVMAITISITYLAEIESVCFIDQLTGDRERMFAESMKIKKENAALFGLPEPTSVDDPQCLVNFHAEVTQAFHRELTHL